MEAHAFTAAGAIVAGTAAGIMATGADTGKQHGKLASAGFSFDAILPYVMRKLARAELRCKVFDTTTRLTARSQQTAKNLTCGNAGDNSETFNRCIVNGAVPAMNEMLKKLKEPNSYQ